MELGIRGRYGFACEEQRGVIRYDGHIKKVLKQKEENWN